ncbi:protein ALP1-like [Miscanthus floridulus]|uniref:protein ALP1-like n=1 Tax=Miscanthus floridulus TaxID=154761 RepID=UPI003459543A
MNNRLKAFVFAAAAHWLLCVMAIVVRSRKRKRVARREGITYAPIYERDRKRMEYLNDKIWKDDTTCVNMLRMNKARFFRFCKLFRDRGLLEDTVHMCVEEQVAMFLHTVGHNVRNRVIATNFGRSRETVGRYFNKVLHAIGELRDDYIRPPSLDTPAKIEGDPRWYPYFKDCIGALDGTHIRATIPKEMQHAFRGRYKHCTQNVLAAVDFDQKFTYVLAGWEGTAHDALVLRDALTREGGLRVPQGKYYLVDAGYGAKPGFLSPFRGVRYHLNEWGRNPVQNEKELFNRRHCSLRIIVEQAFGALKRRFKVLDDASPFFPYETQVDIVVACCIIHNWVIEDGSDEFNIPSDNDEDTQHTTYAGTTSENAIMLAFREGLAAQMWADRQSHGN